MKGSSGLGLHCKVYINSAQLSELYVNIAVKECKFSSRNSTDITKPETGVLFANSVELMLSSVNISVNNASGVYLMGTRATFEGGSFIILNRALLGRGICLCSKSLLYFRDNTKLLISNIFIIAILFLTVTFPFTISLLCIRNTFKQSNNC